MSRKKLHSNYNYAIIYAVSFILMFFGLLAFHKWLGRIPPLYIIGIIVLDSVVVFTFDYLKKREYRKGSLIGYGMRIWLKPFHIFGGVMGPIMIILDYSEFQSGHLYGISTIVGFHLIISSILEAKDYYLTLTPTKLIKEDLHKWNYSDISKIEIREESLYLKVKDKIHPIVLSKLKEEERSDLIKELKEKTGLIF